MWSQLYIGLHVKYPSFCQILTKLEFSREISEKWPKMKFHENASNGSRVPWGRTDEQTHMAKLIFLFSNFANTPRNLDNKFSFWADLK